MSSKRSISTGWFASCDSTGMLEALNAIDMASQPSRSARAAVPERISSYTTVRRLRRGSKPPHVGFAKCEPAAVTRSGSAGASAPITASKIR